MTDKRPIIIVDDDQDDLDLMTDLLRAIGNHHPIKTFSNSKDAFQYLVSDGQPLIIFSDINMPGENGITFKRKIDAHPDLRRKSVPFVFLSTVISSNIVEDAFLEFSVQGFFKKPDSMEAYRKLIGNILSYWEVCEHPNK